VADWSVLIRGDLSWRAVLADRMWVGLSVGSGIAHRFSLFRHFARNIA